MKISHAKLFNQALICILLLSLSFALAGTARAQNCTAPAGGWTISNQPPVGCRPYQSSVFNQQLPNAGSGGPMTHLAPNSDAIAQNTLGYNSSFYGVGTLQLSTSGNNGGNGNPFYYGRASDPIYKFTNSCSSHVGASDPTPAVHDPTNTFWHIPNQAAMSGGQSDEFITVWDQTTNKVFSAYATGSGVSTPPNKLPNCTATTTATACPMFSMSYCNMADYTTDKGYQAGTGAGDSLHQAPAALYISIKEWMAGTINHALYLNTNCEASQTVFPASGHAFTCPGGDSGHPPHGALYFLDYTDAQIASMSIPAWQKAIITAMAHYGGYVGDTDGSSNLQITANRYEAGEAYLQAGLPNPLTAWLASQGIGHHTDGTSQTYSLPLWGGIPNLTGPNCPSVGCGVSQHTHIADQCVPLGLAGKAGGCVDAAATSLPNAPTGLTAIVE